MKQPWRPASNGYIHIKVLMTGELVALPARLLPFLKIHHAVEAPNGHWAYYGELADLLYYKDAEVIG